MPLANHLNRSGVYAHSANLPKINLLRAETIAAVMPKARAFSFRFDEGGGEKAGGTGFGGLFHGLIIPYTYHSLNLVYATNSDSATFGILTSITAYGFLNAQAF